jgi:peptide/nickel transport system substrate-binding protein
MTGEESDFSDVVSRRQFVKLTGVTGAAALAGCTDGGSSTDTEGGSDGTATGDGMEIEYPDTRHDGVTTLDPSNVQWNPVNSDNYAQISHYLLFEDFATYDYNAGEFTPAAVSEWEFTGDTFEMTLRDDLTWSNGDQVTAEDVVTQLKIAEYDEDAMWSWASGVEANGDTEVTVSIGQDVNPSLVEVDVLDRRLAMDRATYGSYLEDLDSGDAEVSEVRGFADSDPVTNGPFELDQKDSQILLTTLMEDSPFASNINFGEYAFNFLSDNNARHQALQSLEVDSDYSVGAPQTTYQDFPSEVKQVQIPDVWGMGLAPNFNHPIAGDRAVRQAVQYVINRSLCVENSYPTTKVAPPVPTGISTDYQETWLGDSMSDFEEYGYDSRKTEEAAAVLEEAGYERVDGTWQTSDGTPVAIPITHPQGWGDWTLALETAVDHLNEFGFDASLEGTGSYFDALTSDDWVFIANTWLHGGPSPYPFYSLRHQLVQPAVQAAHTNYPGYTEQYGGSNADITVPAMSGDGELTVNPGDRLSELSTTTDEATEQEIVQELAWVCNQDLPRIPIKEKSLQQWLTSDEWDIPSNLEEDADANVTWAATHLPRVGKMNYSG